MKDRYIYHILNANASHLSLQIVTAILLRSAHKHFFILIGEKNKKELYDKIFLENNKDNYLYFSSFKEFRKSSSFVQKKDCILMHAGSYLWMLFFFIHQYRNVNWICWGAGMVLSKRLLSKCSFIVKYLLYNWFNSVVVLMTPELEYARKVYHIKNVFYMEGNYGILF